MADKPLIVQSDRSILLDVHAQHADQARSDLIACAELIKSPEHIHTYAITAISIWNAASAGIGSKEILRRLEKWSRFSIPEQVSFYIQDMGNRFGSFVLVPDTEDDTKYLLQILVQRYEKEILAHKHLSQMLHKKNEGIYELERYQRGELKVQLIKLGFPVDDRIPLHKGEPIEVAFKPISSHDKPFVLRDYQRIAASSVLGDGRPGTGFGTIVLPCGSGKTIVGMEILTQLSTRTLILTTNVAAVHQWISELCDKLTVTMDMVGEYTGNKKEIKPITVCTYQVLTWRADKTEDFPHMKIFREGNWGLIIYDEVHMLPAPVFKITAELQAIYRVGLTATLIREDHKEDEVFSLVGPKRYDVPWSELEEQGWIAEAICTEIRIPLPGELELPYAIGNKREKFRIASTNPLKFDIIKQLIELHHSDFILIIGQYIDQLQSVAKELSLPLITGSTANAKREELYKAFKEGKERILVVSKVANFAIDLPDASVAIQISGTFGSRQEEAQRLGRILRPKKQSSHFYSLVTRFTSEEEFASHRQKFLTEQGYQYQVEVWD